MKKLLLSVAMAAVFMPTIFAQSEGKVKNDEFKFTDVKVIPTTRVENQNRSSTCWSFSGQSFIEAEILRQGKKSPELSEMFVVNHSYKDKAEKTLRLDGALNFAPGGSFYDVLYVFKHYGAVPESIMQGLNYGEKMHLHNELDALASAVMKAIERNPNKTISPAWKKAFGGVIDAYLGELPEKFEYEGKEYTPKSFASTLGINPDDYVSITSYTHHPFYAPFALEIPDNWRWSLSYNLPIDEMMQVMESAIMNGYPIAWGADVSEMGFTRNGTAILTDLETVETSGSDQARWLGLSNKDKLAEVRSMVTDPNCPEINVTQELRQQWFDNKKTTDDHGMLMCGLAKDQNGKKFYMIQNSWGTDNKYKGIWYVSESYVKGKTMNFVVHKNALPKEIAKKLGIR